MKLVITAALAAFIWAGGIGSSHAQNLLRRLNESDLAFAQRALHFNSDSDPHVVAATWNGVSTVFVDYLVDKNEESVRQLVALTRQAGGGYSAIQVTEGEEQGAVAAFDAIGLAEADRSGSKALITILSWDQSRHALVSGTLYEVRIFAMPRPGQTHLSLMKISRHFGAGCECWHNDRGPRDKPYWTHYRFKTIAAVKAELKKMGF